MSEPTASYSFIPWVRQGLSNFMEDSAGGTASTTVKTSLKVKTGSTSQTVTVDLQLAGPGDVIGIQPRSIINTFPKNGENSFVTANLPFIEFYEEDFPWRFTPAKAVNDRLVPWVTLLVLEQDEFVAVPDEEAPLPLIQVVRPEVFPTPSTLWAWAHVHSNASIATDIAGSTDDFLNGELKQNPDLAFSRLLSPRRLKTGTTYTAFLIPTFEAGRRAGAGEAAATDLPVDAVAWATSGVANLRFPVYYQWNFRTDDQANFMYAVRQLKAVNLADVAAPVAGETGPMLTLDTSGYEMVVPTYQQVKMVGALKGAGEDDSRFLADLGFADSVRDLLNLTEARLQEAGAVTGNTSPFSGDPVITPPMYGRWHAGVKTVDAIPRDPEDPANVLLPAVNWLQQVNLDPRYRAVAGIGSRIVQQNQEAYVREAWEQLGDILQVNSYLRELQAGVKLGAALKDKYLASLAPAPVTSGLLGGEAISTLEANDHLLLVMAPTLSRVQVESAEGTVTAPLREKTAEALIRESNLPLAAFEGTFRKLLVLKGTPDEVEELPGDPGAQTSGSNIISKLNSGELSADMTKPLEEDQSVFNTIDASSYRILKEDSSPTLFMAGQVQASELAPDVAQRFRQAVNDLPAALTFPVLEHNTAAPLGAIAGTTVAEADQQQAAARKVAATVEGIGAGNATGLESSAGTPLGEVAPLVVAPYFKQPVYEVLKGFAEELFLPDISRVPQNTITLLEVNQQFIEALMVGLNHEMAAELLWREFPTDQRGSYFRQFWDTRDSLDTNVTEAAKTDITPIHTWPLSSGLGEHKTRAGSGNLVLLIRGDLLRKFPNTIIYAQEVVEVEGQAELQVDGQKRFPVSRADLDSGVTVLIFELDTATVESSPYGWYFVLAERPGQPTFSLELTPLVLKENLTSWEQFSWGHLPADRLNLELSDFELPPPTGTQTGNAAEFLKIENSAQLAYATFRNPAMVALPAEEFIQ